MGRGLAKQLERDANPGKGASEEDGEGGQEGVVVLSRSHAAGAPPQCGPRESRKSRTNNLEGRDHHATHVMYMYMAALRPLAPARPWVQYHNPAIRVIRSNLSAQSSSSLSELLVWLRGMNGLSFPFRRRVSPLGFRAPVFPFLLSSFPRSEDG